MTKIKPIFRVDSYKASHYLQYPPNTKFVSSYIESRGGAYPYAVFNGLQALLLDLEANPITREDVIRASALFKAHGEPFNLEGWMYIVEKHAGRLPIKISAVREGSVIPTNNVLVQIVNTDPNVPWLTSYCETMLLRAVWYPTTVATRSHFIKGIIRNALELSGDVNELPFKLHDFGARGVSSSESAAIGGCAHLINFQGTDTVEALLHAEEVYGISMAGFSIPAAEHSTITSWGKDRETDAYRNMLKQYGSGLVAVVSDSYDIWNAIRNIWGKTLKEDVQNMGGVLIIRPDSGDPNVVPVLAVEELDAVFGHTVNAKGYKVLNNVRVIQGDGINERTIKNILDSLLAKGYSASNIAFGMGGELLQTVNRDTMKFAMKASAAMVDDQWIDVFKSPIDDKGKMSKKGVLALVKKDGEIKTVHVTEALPEHNLLETVFENGKCLRYQSFDSVRAESEKT